MPTEAPFRNSHLGNQASDHNRALKNIGIPWLIPTQALDQDLLVLGTGLSPIGHGTHTEVDPTVMGHWDDSAATGSKFVDQHANAIDAGAADTLLVPAVEQDELDFFVIGQNSPFFAVGFTNATPASAGVFAYEYLNRDGVWTAFVAGTFNDGTANFQNTTDKSYLTFEPPEDWAAVEPDDEIGTSVLDEIELVLLEGKVPKRYYIRGRVTTVFTIQPDIDVVEVVEMTATVTNAHIAPATGVISHMQIAAVTAGGGNIDVEVLVINHTQQKRGSFTFNVAARQNERVAANRGCFVSRGDECTFHVLREDGTTEMQSITVLAEIEI